MFLALRDLRFARGRFALVGLVIGLVALMATLLSGLANGLVLAVTETSTAEDVETLAQALEEELA